MKTYLFHNPESVTQEQFEKEMLPLLPQWRKEQALRYKFLMGRVQCAAAFVLLKNGLKNDFGIDEEIEFDYIANEKPVLRHYPDIHFNLSHCKKGILCVIDNTTEVGCDIEAVERGISDSLLHYCCNAQEIASIEGSANSNAEFIRLWTIKEAVLKCSGKGITNNLRDLLTPQLLSNLEIETHPCLEEGFIYTTCRKILKP